MNRNYYLQLAAQQPAFPIGADLVLREQPDHEAILHDGARLGRVCIDSAERFRAPLAFPIMDLMLEKAQMLRCLGIPEADIPTWHFHGAPGASQLAAIRHGVQAPLDARMQANVDAVRYVAQNSALVPVGMSIGPFSLMTKLLSDPITPVFLAGTGLTAAEDEEVRAVEEILELCTDVILRYFRAQAAAGAKAFFIAEPAANKVYISPNQMAEGSDIFDRVVLRPWRRIKAELDAAGVDLLFHCCGELVPEMITGFCSLRPALLSLGSSRKLWEDAALVPKEIVLYGNLPSKKFFSDDEITVAQVMASGRELIAKMQAAGHPFILGTECDVLSVDGCAETILRKALAITACGGTATAGAPANAGLAA